MRHCVSIRRVAVPVMLFAALSLMGCERRQNTVVVSGVGTVRAQPDTINMTISLRHTAETTREAQAAVTGMVRQALEILHHAGVEERNIGTAFLRFSPEYEWGPMGRVFLGQRAEQMITFSIDDIGIDSERVSAIIDRLIGINGIELQGMHFSVGDPAELQAKARELAFLDASSKARQYAQLAYQRIVGTRSIFEEGHIHGVSFPPAQARAGQRVMFAADAAVEAAGSTVLPAGEMEISARITIEFLMR